MMKGNRHVVAFLVALLFQWSSVVIAAEQVIESPQKEVEKITRELLATFANNIHHYKKDDAAFIAEVDRQLSPSVAFDAIARGVMGKYSRRAKSGQIEQFSRTFKDSLISFYGKALLRLDDTRLTIEKVDAVPDNVLNAYRSGKARLVPVDMTVKTSSGTVAISYSMVYQDERWKLRNIIVDGINIGIQFRNQFAEAMSKYNDLQYVVDHWPEIMQGEATENNAAGKQS
ncbi:ABC transporter substrate-binding protein [Endozoicomonas sp. GU-1]|uniref:MlaC/ttg2D family ABC transporter substrate-binding protein n=1 Tax=Endozoicomonas sp. GU-1 TaxID=3009078 RepID=UPI0022B4FEDD|nr:ABC transporter substrate-binding protein [Endozoicomonas sp. GU-1]WBA80880.1 ABC transporter substrate-binding protein [Endozoicomonas sp. GU-1]WBA88444.1 ABC transporter substrate-binding protein [Endozoicomonas sp. GU-1]